MRKVANSALAKSRVFGVAPRTASINQSGGVQNAADLVGERGAARGAVGGELGLVQRDEVFRLPTPQYRAS